MNSKNIQYEDAAELRRQAEAAALEKATQSPDNMETLSPEEVRRTLYELRVHQIELEMQNEELRRVQAQLEIAKARYFDLYDQAPVGYVTLSDKGLILEGNLTAAALLGVTRSVMFSRPISQFILPEDRNLYYLHRKLLYETGAPQTYELRMVKKSGMIFWAHLVATAVQNADNCRLVMSDITERKQTEETIKNLTKFPEESSNPVFKTSKNGVLLYANPASRKLISKIQTRTGKKIPGKWIKMIKSVYDSGEKQQAEIKLDGGVFLFDMAPVTESGYVNIYATNITQRKQIENEVHLLAAAVQNSNDAIMVQDLKGNIISWNLGAERMYGYSKSEAMKLNASRIIPGHKQKEMRDIIEKLKKKENIDCFETMRVTKDNRILHISLTATLLRDGTGKPFAATITERDITEHKLLEKEILEITEKERKLIGQEMHDSMGQVLTGVAVKSKGLALKLKGKSPIESKDALAISRLANMAIAQMRDLARLLYPVDIEAGGLVTALQSLASNAEKILDVKCRFLCEKPVFVNNLVEAKQFYRIAQEAVTNATKHGKAKNITIELRSTEDLCILSVKNDGLAFQKSSREKKGLGLKIMEYRANLMSGTLDIRKGKKNGTVVTCTISKNFS